MKILSDLIKLLHNEYVKLLLITLLRLSLTNKIVELKELIDRIKIVNYETLRETISKLNQYEIISIINDEMIKVNKPAELALILIMSGADPEHVSKYVTWHDFEALVTKELSELGFETYKNIRLRKPKALEIDILAIDTVSKFCLVIDCKHWLPGYSKIRKLMSAAHKHIERTLKLANSCEWLIRQYGIIRKCKYFVPALVTLTDLKVRTLLNCAIIPITLLRSFVFDIHKFIEELNILKLKNRCYIAP